MPQQSDIYDDELNVGLAASKTLVKLGWRICMDSYRTLLPLIYPPHTMALGSIFVASLLLSFEQPPSQIANGEVSNQHIVELLSGRTTSDWQQRFHTGPQDLEGVSCVSVFLAVLGFYARQTLHIPPSTCSFNIPKTHQPTLRPAPLRHRPRTCRTKTSAGRLQGNSPNTHTKPTNSFA